MITNVISEVMRSRNKQGVVLHLLPLNSIINEKRDNSDGSHQKTGSIMMTGKSTVSEDGCEVNFDETDITNGDLHVIVAHPESMYSEKGSAVLRHLIRNNLLLAVVSDEMHKTIHWSGMMDKVQME